MRMDSADSISVVQPSLFSKQERAIVISQINLIRHFQTEPTEEMDSPYLIRESADGRNSGSDGDCAVVAVLVTFFHSCRLVSRLDRRLFS